MALTSRSRQAMVVVALVAVVVPTLSGVPQRTPPLQTPSPAEASWQRAMLQEYCVGCHNPRTKAGGLDLDALDVTAPSRDADAWERVVRKLRVEAMPPSGARRPDAAAYDRLIAGVEGALDAARPEAPGRPVFRRLNRAEYANAIRDLLGLDVDVTSLLPPDNSAFGFDNVSDAQGSSPALLQAYLAAARTISAVATGDSRIAAGSDTYSVRQDLSQGGHLDGLPLGTVGGMRARHTFPVDGDYEFQVRLYRTNLSAIRGLEDPQELELTLDGEPILKAAIGGEADLVALQTNPTDTSDTIEATRLRVRRHVGAGQRDVAAAFIEKTPPLLETNRLQRFIRDFPNPFDAEGAPHVLSITVRGPFDGTGAETPPSPHLFSCTPTPAAGDSVCARRILSAIARRAYRRPPTPTEVEDLLSYFNQGRRSGDPSPGSGQSRSTSSDSFRTGVQFALRRILASPSFVFRPEPEPAGLAPGTAYRVSDLALASRLSFFLWSSIPDEQLLRLGETGGLRRPGVQDAQMRRLLADPRSSAFVSNFAGQWLLLRNLRGKVPNSDLFPDFDDNLRQAFQREAELFVASIIADDRSVLDLMTAADTFVNERLARHYGIDGVLGSHFRRVRLADSTRHGLLGKGAILLATSHPTTTSPVLRGKWVLENILGTPPPPPPADLDTALKSEPPGAPRQTVREQIERHRASPVCSACHQSMDPIGFALERFDVVGAARTADADGLPIDTGAVLASGAKVAGIVELRQALLKRPDVFTQTLTEKMLVYALGRGLTPDDMPVVRKIVREAAREGYRFSALVRGIVSSTPFQMRVAGGGA